MASKKAKRALAGHEAEAMREKGRMGGIKSGEARRRRKALRETLEALLSATAPDGRTMVECLTGALLDKALTGDVRAFEIIRDTIGEKPVAESRAEISGGMVITWQK